MIAEAFAIEIRCGTSTFTIAFPNLLSIPGFSKTYSLSRVVLGALSGKHYAPYFKAYIIVNDIQLAINAGEETAMDPTITTTALDTYKKAVPEPRY